MRVLGLNLGRTRLGKVLKDGGACVVEDGYPTVAVSEERVVREKHEGGFEAALEYCLGATGLSINDFDSVVVSSCCEDVRKRPVDGLDVCNSDKVCFIPSHHLSHAYSAFCASPFEEALVVVMDGGGNVMGRQRHADWWRHPREQNSYYLGSGAALSIFGRDFDGPLEVGFGEAYRSFTHYLGWPSSAFAGCTMALAAYGDPERYADVRLFDLKDEHLVCEMRNDPLHPTRMVRQLAEQAGADMGEPRLPGAEIEQVHKDLACFVQAELERALVAKVRLLCNRTGITNLCIAGGVGLNCLANTRLLTDTPVANLFVQPASGDHGQALGNALYGYHSILGRPRSWRMTHAYFGKDYTEEIEALIPHAFGTRDFHCVRSPAIARDVATCIRQGLIVAWFQGKSETGSRALGNRSIVADPTQRRVKRILDQRVKRREPFRPYAPSVLREAAATFFQTVHDSPFMLLAANVKPGHASLVPAVVHVDGTARLQTVSQADNPKFYELINEFRHLTGIPMVLNTSFNGPGEPIVETPADAIQCFRENNIDVLAIGDYLVTRRDSSPE